MAAAHQSIPVLEQELRFFDLKKSDLLEHNKGQYALIKGDKLIGTYTTEAEAYSQGIQQLGNVAFLIKLVADTEEPVWIPLVNMGLS